MERDRQTERETHRETERERELYFTHSTPTQASLCTVDIDSGSVDFPDELPCLPNEDRLLVQVSEKLHQHDVHCSDMVDLPHSPDSLNLTPQKPSIIEAIRYTYHFTIMISSLLIFFFLCHAQNRQSCEYHFTIELHV